MADPEIRIASDGHWEWYVLKDMTEEERVAITGKYLFFSTNRKLLVDVATAELREHGFCIAKIVLPEKRRGVDFVLCLYSEDDSRRHELARRYCDTKNLKYRYWKSEEETRERKTDDEER